MRESLWPKMGWTRAFRYYGHRMFRSGDSAYRVTAGLASGAAVSFSPFLGLHIILALIITRLLRGNWIAAVGGTLWGNPATFPLLFTASYMCGEAVLMLFGLEKEGSYLLPATMTLDYLVTKPVSFLEYLFANPLELLLPMTLGSIIVGTVFWFAAYAALYYPVKALRKVFRRHQMALRKRIKSLRHKKDKAA